MTLARVAIARGNLARALEQIRGSVLMARESGCDVWRLLACAAYAELAATLGRRVQAAVYWRLFIADRRAETFERDTARRALEALALSDAEAHAAREALARLTLESACEAILNEPVSADARTAEEA